MTSMISARIPTSTKRHADTLLARLGASHTDLINSAYAYLLQNHCLPPLDAPQKDAPLRLLLHRDVCTCSFVPPRHAKAGLNRLLSMAVFGDVELWACDHDVHEIPHALPGDLAAALHTLHVYPLDSATIQRARTDMVHCPSVRLTLVVAQKVGANAIVTYDTAAFPDVPYEVLTPDMVTELLERERGVTFEEFLLV